MSYKNTDKQKYDIVQANDWTILVWNHPLRQCDNHEKMGRYIGMMIDVSKDWANIDRGNYYTNEFHK